jgi:hypothetical protein
MLVATIDVGVEFASVQEAWMCLVQGGDADHLHCGLELVAEDWERWLAKLWIDQDTTGGCEKRGAAMVVNDVADKTPKMSAWL